MGSEILVISVHVHTLLLRLESMGESMQDLMARFGVPPTALESPVAPVPLSLFDALCAYGEARTDNPLFGLHANYYCTGEEYGLGKYSVTSQPNLREAIQIGFKLWEHMACPFFVSFFEQDGLGRVLIEPKHPTSIGLVRYMDFVLALVFQVSNTATGIPVTAKEVVMGHSPRASLKTYQETFNCPVRFAPGASHVLFSSATLDTPTVSPDEMLARLATAEVQRQTEAHFTEGMDLVSVVRTILDNAGSPEDWRLSSVAAVLRLPPRTLQHKLQQASTSFNLLVDVVRRNKTQHYLSRGVQQKDIAFLLGYNDTTSFRKAFRRWYAAPPGKWRSDLGTL